MLIQVFQGERTFTRDNKSLGTFQLTGILPAPMGVPRIEVTFDIDTNGIVHVSAKDQNTNKEQSMTISGGSALSKEEIDRMVKEAEAHAEEDKKRREEADLRNSAEQTVYSIEKLLKDNAEKLPEEIAKEVREASDKVKKALEGEDIEAVKTAMEELNTKSQKIGETLYAQTQAEAAQSEAASGAEAADAGAGAEDEVIDAEVVDEEDENK